LRFQTRNPAAAAQTPPIIQRTFFIAFPLPYYLIASRAPGRVGCDAVAARLLSITEVFCGEKRNDYTADMDSVRFGRALGIGARAAAKTLVTAVDAATAPNPSSGAKSKQSRSDAPTPVAASRVETSGVRLGQKTAQTTAQVRQTGQGLKRGSKRFGEAIWGPFVKASSQLWLELTGVFFGIFAVFAGSNVWRMRANLRETAANHDTHVRFLWSVAMAILFGYFCLSSFVRANRRGKRS